MSDELAEYLDALARDDCYRVDAVLKESAFETTERVFFTGANGAELGPFVRKRLDDGAGLGAAYERIWESQRAGSRFTHLPRIVECYLVGERRVVVMEYVQGETLADAVHRCKPSLGLACDVFPKLCEAASELHDGFDPPLIHRDLKPSNIILTNSNLTIIDFGITRTFDGSSDEDTRHFGTRAYAPPEQFGYGQTDVRSDVYALGMLLYFCLTADVADAGVRKNGFRDVRIPEVLRCVIARATAFDPSQRYESVSSLRRAFDEAMMQVAPVCELDHPSPFVAPAMRLSSRRPLRFNRALGIVWDVLLAVSFVFYMVAATSMAFYPSSTDSIAQAPLIVRSCVYYSIVLFVVGPVLYLMSDRRPIRRLVPRLAGVSFKRELIVCLLMFVVGTLIVAIAGQFALPLSS